MLVINELHHSTPEAELQRRMELDVNGDHGLSRLDALLITNYLNASAATALVGVPQAEGEAPVSERTSESPLEWDLLEVDRGFGHDCSGQEDDLDAFASGVTKQHRQSVDDDFFLELGLGTES